MTKRILFAAVTGLLFLSLPAMAQSEKSQARPGLMAVYEDWKQKQQAGKAEAPEHLAMVVISQRIDEGHAQLDLALINTRDDQKLGDELMLEIQPMLTIRDADGKAIDSKAVGFPTRTFITADEAGNLDSPTTVSVLVSADVQADAVMVKWILSKRTTDEKQILSNNTMHLLLSGEPNSALTAITKAKPAEQ
ncbi:MAG: hypothetical protein ACKVZH_20180 [Blastocatellia bacterium]